MSDHLSRREVARLLGFGSDFPVRRLEQDGRLRAVRGAMGQAWYPRAEVLALRDAEAVRRQPTAIATGWGSPAPPSEGSESQTDGRGLMDGRERLDGRERWTDAALIARLRELVPTLDPAPDAGAVRPRTVVDLVADTGIGIARAVRVYRFWLRHDVHPTADLARRLAGDQSAPSEAATSKRTPSHPVAANGPTAKPERPQKPEERRAPERLERDGLIRKLRDPDPTIRARAFEKLRPGRAT